MITNIPIDDAAAKLITKECEFIDILDNLGLSLAYPPSKDPCVLEFWCNKDPRRLKAFHALMEDYEKECTVSYVANQDYFIRIADEGYDLESKYGKVED